MGSCCNGRPIGEPDGKESGSREYRRGRHRPAPEQRVEDDGARATDEPRGVDLDESLDQREARATPDHEPKADQGKALVTEACAQQASGEGYRDTWKQIQSDQPPGLGLVESQLLPP